MTDAAKNSVSASWGFWGLLGLALLLRLMVVWHYAPELTDDRDGYLGIAEQLIQGNGYNDPATGEPTAFRPPLYPVLLALFVNVGGIYGIAFLQIVAGLLCVVGTVFLAQSLEFKRGAWLAGLIIAVEPLLLRYTPQPMTEVVCTALVIWLVWSWTQLLKTGHRNYLLATGLLFGLACLCRPSFLPLPAVLILLQTGELLLRKKSTPVDVPINKQLKDIAKQGLLVGLLGFIVMLPWGIRNQLVMGQFKLTTTHGGYTILLGNNPVFYQAVVRQNGTVTWGDYADTDPQSQAAWYKQLQQQLSDGGFHSEFQRDQAQNRMAFDTIRQEPITFLQACLMRLQRLWNPVPIGPEAGQLPRIVFWGLWLFSGTVYLLAITGFVAHWLTGGNTRKLWLAGLAVVITLCCVHLVYWTNARMRTPLMSIVAVWAAAGVEAIRHRRSTAATNSNTTAD